MPVPEPVQSHQARQVAESFGTDAARYDRARPPYPDALVQRIIAASPGTDVLDVGCGTGIVSRQFRAAGCTVLGVDPDERMADFARHTGIDVETGTFETWDPRGRSFDAVVAGQSWHWVDPVAGAAKAGTVLRPQGTVTAFWHVFEPPHDIREAFATAFARAVPDSPFNVLGDRQAGDVYQAMLTKAADGMRAAGGFGAAEQWRFDWQHDYTRDEWLDLLPTTGGLTRLSSGTLAEVLTAVGSAIDAIGGGFTMFYTTFAVTARRA